MSTTTNATAPRLDHALIDTVYKPGVGYWVHEIGDPTKKIYVLRIADLWIEHDSDVPDDVKDMFLTQPPVKQVTLHWTKYGIPADVKKSVITSNEGIKVSDVLLRLRSHPFLEVNGKASTSKTSRAERRGRSRREIKGLKKSGAFPLKGPVILEFARFVRY